VDSVGRSVRNPLGDAFYNAKEGEQFKLQVGNDGVSYASQLVGRDGAARNVQLGEMQPSWDTGRGSHGVGVGR